MAFDLNTGPFLLKEGLIQIGTWSTVTAIGTAGDGDPLNHFAGSNLAYFRQGTTTIEMPRSYAEARGFTPSIKLRKDLIQKDFNIMAEIFQYEIDLFELLEGMYVQAAYSGGGWDGDLGWIGSDEPTQPHYGYLITTALTDGTPFYIAMWYGKVTTEDPNVALSGTDYATINMRIEAFNHPDFDATGTDAQKHYGMWWLDT